MARSAQYHMRAPAEEKFWRVRNLDVGNGQPNSTFFRDDEDQARRFYAAALARGMLVSLEFAEWKEATNG